MPWEPIDESRLQAEIESAELSMEPQALAVWNLIRIRPVKWRLSPWGDLGGGFWVVGVVGQQCIWYNDIEHSFGIIPFSEFGVIGECGCSQLELHQCINQIVEVFRNAGGDIERPRD